MQDKLTVHNYVLHHGHKKGWKGTINSQSGFLSMKMNTLKVSVRSNWDCIWMVCETLPRMQLKKKKCSAAVYKSKPQGRNYRKLFHEEQMCWHLVALFCLCIISMTAGVGSPLSVSQNPRGTYSNRWSSRTAIPRTTTRRPALDIVCRKELHLVNPQPCRFPVS